MNKMTHLLLVNFYNFLPPALNFQHQAKTFDTKTSILHYLVKLLKRNEEELLSFKDDIEPVFDAQRILLDNTCDEIMNLSKELERIEKIIKKHVHETDKMTYIHRTQHIKQVHSPPKENKSFWQMSAIERFILDACNSMDEAITASHNTKEKFKSLLKYFGEDETMKSDDFFGTLQAFVLAFGIAQDQVVAQEKAAVSIIKYIFEHLFVFALLTISFL